jgi:hypothetical protein
MNSSSYKQLYIFSKWQVDNPNDVDNSHQRTASVVFDSSNIVNYVTIDLAVGN